MHVCVMERIFAVILCFGVTGLLCVVASVLPGYGVLSQADVLVMCVLWGLLFPVNRNGVSPRGSMCD